MGVWFGAHRVLAARRVIAWTIVVAACAGLSLACGSTPFGRQYEYEEDVTLDLDGSARVTVNASLAALHVLRGLDVGPYDERRVDRDRIRAAFESPVARVTRVSRPWTRAGRRFVQVRIEVDDIRRLAEAPPFSWSQYHFAQHGEQVAFRQIVGSPAAPRDDTAGIAWTGRELVAFRLHLPSRILFHNVRDLERNLPGEVERGNILRWEQRLEDRLRGTPIEMSVRMDGQSILYRTIWLFVLAFGAAVATLAGAIWWAVRREARRDQLSA
jgi:hypothetical protein